MLTLPILPDEIALPLGHVMDGDFEVCNYPGVVAFVRPLDVEVASRWNDAFPTRDMKSVAATTLVFDQLVRIEGLAMKDVAGVAGPFDVKNALHRRSIPMAMRSGIYLGLLLRASVSEEQEKNSDSPSALDGTTATASSPAEVVASESATSSPVA